MGEGWKTNWVDTKWTTKLGSWPPDIPVHRVEAKAGECIIFSEKLKHGTIPWSGAGERRTLFYKYVRLALSRFVDLSALPLPCAGSNATS